MSNDDSRNDWDPGRLLGLSGSYWQTFTLHAAVKLDLFSKIGDDQWHASDLASALEASTDALERLLNALTAMDLIEKQGDLFKNTDAARKLLNKASPGYIGYMIMHHHHLAPSWLRLDEAVCTGAAVRERASFSDPVQRESFLMGMFNIAMSMAPQVVDQVDLAGRRRLLDLGGGPGTYAIHFCQANPGLRAAVYDLPTTAPFAERTIDRFGLSAQIEFIGGDYLNDPIPGQYDCIWMSHILHGEGPQACQRLIAKAAAALEPGGLIMVHDFILNDANDGPLFPALFSLNMLLGTESGRSYTQGELIKMLSAAGVAQIQRLDYVGPTESGILIGKVG